MIEKGNINNYGWIHLDKSRDDEVKKDNHCSDKLHATNNKFVVRPKQRTKQ
jgi:hypothetical protein